MADLSELTSMIEAALPGAQAQIVDQGGGDHLAASVVAPQFAGLTRLEAQKSSRKPADFRESSLHFSADQSGGVPPDSPEASHD